MKELDIAVLRCGLPEFGLEAGDVGTVVHEHDGGAYEVEFVSGEGGTVAVVTLRAEDLRPIEGREILHVRRLAGR